MSIDSGAGISVRIKAGTDQNSSKIAADGSVTEMISDQGRRAFKITDKELKYAAKKLMGLEPNDAFVKSPTPWNDLYKTYGWSQVHAVAQVTGAEILEVTSEPTIVMTQVFENQGSNRGTFYVEISQSVQDVATSTWNNEVALGIEQKLSYGVEFLGSGVKGETTLSYSEKFGVGGEHSTAVTVGSASGLNVQLDPGQSAVAELSASRGVLKARVHYKLHLTGSVAMNYDPAFLGHHFYARSISGILAAAGKQTSIETTEDIELGDYSNATVIIRDKDTNQVLETFALDDSLSWVSVVPVDAG